MLLNATFVFAATFWLDFVWAKYTAAVTERRAERAAVLSGIIILFGAAATITYVDNHWMVVPATIGAALGTYAGIKK